MYEFSDDDDEWLVKGEEEDGNEIPYLEMEGQQIDDEPDLSDACSKPSHDGYSEDEGTREFVKRKSKKFHNHFKQFAKPFKRAVEGKIVFQKILEMRHILERL